MNKVLKHNDLKIAYIHEVFPWNNPPFILNELYGLEKLGFDITIFSLSHSSNGYLHQQGERWFKRTIYLTSCNVFAVMWAHLFFILTRTKSYFKILFKYPEYGGKRGFLVGIYFAKLIKKEGFKHIHAPWAWFETNLAMLISGMLGITYSFTAHAADIYKRPDNLKKKIDEAKFVITCVKGNKKYMLETYGKDYDRKIHVVYHGLDLEKFSNSFSYCKHYIDILSVGRLTEKKGMKYLVKACKILKEKGLLNRCVIVGEGTEYENLSSLISSLGLESNVQIKKQVDQEEIISMYHKSKIFVLHSIIAKTNDIDGIPNVLMEAMSLCKPVISTDLPNIRELIETEKDGILVCEKNTQALAYAIERVLTDKNLRDILGKNAREKILREFDSRQHVQKLARIFTEVV